jgi:hypothetical protein
VHGMHHVTLDVVSRTTCRAHATRNRRLPVKRQFSDPPRLVCSVVAAGLCRRRLGAVCRRARGDVGLVGASVVSRG